MPPPTSIGPIRETRINQVLYVGEIGAKSIQAAVNFAVAEGGSFLVVIPYGYTAADHIAAVVNGSVNIMLCDQRGSSQQNYVWNGSAYAPADFTQLGNFIMRSIDISDPLTTPLGGFANYGWVQSLNRSRIIANSSGTSFGEFEFSASNSLGGFETFLVLDANYAIFDTGIQVAGDATFSTDADVAGTLTAATLTADTLTANTIAAPSMNISDPLTSPLGGHANYGWVESLNRSRIIAASSGTSFGEFEFSASNSTSGFETYLVLDASTAVFSIGLQVDGDATFSTDVDVEGTLTAATADIATANVTNQTVSGTLILDNDPTQGQEAATKHYVDLAIAESGSFVYPDPGVPISTGTAWGTSIDPATLARTNTSNTFSQAQAITGALLAGASPNTLALGAWPVAGSINPSVTASTHNVVINPATGGTVQISRDAGGGLQVMDGTGSGTPVALIDNTGRASFGTLQLPSETANVVIGGAYNVSDSTQSVNRMQLFVPGQASFSGYGSWGVNVRNTGNAGLANLILDFLANSSVNGTSPKPALSVTGDGELQMLSQTAVLYLGGGANVSNSASELKRMEIYVPGQDGFSAYGNWGVYVRNTGSAGYQNLILDLIPNSAINGTAPTPALTLTGSGDMTCGNLTFGGYLNSTANLFLNPGNSSSSLYLCWNAGSHTYFGNGASGIVGSVDSSGNANFNGDLTAGTKSFKIPHPLDEKKWLTHGCLEGPEHAVYYRGEVQLKGGVANVALPDYFEALTELYGRTVQLTQVDDGDGDLATLIASRVAKGKFRIRSNVADAVVWWEVKAIRKGVKIDVESSREAA